MDESGGCRLIFLVWDVIGFVSQLFVHCTYFLVDRVYSFTDDAFFWGIWLFCAEGGWARLDFPHICLTWANFNRNFGCGYKFEKFYTVIIIIFCWVLLHLYLSAKDGKISLSHFIGIDVNPVMNWLEKTVSCNFQK